MKQPPHSSDDAAKSAETTETVNETATDAAKERAAREARERQAAQKTDKERTAREARERQAEQKAASDQRAAESASGELVREVGGLAGVESLLLPTTGDGDNARRLLLICLDGAAPELALGAWRTQLRTIHMLTNQGTRRRLRAGIPWSSVPAWLSLLSSQEPGRLGIYGPTRRPNHSYAPPMPPDSRDIAEPRLWDILSRAGRTVGVVGLPVTAPAPRVNGHLIAQRTADGVISAYPPTLETQAALWLEDEIEPGVIGDEIERALGTAYALTERRFLLARRLLARNVYDCFMLFDDGIAEVQRQLWHTLDTTHPRYDPDHSAADTISAFYQYVDERIGELLELVESDTLVAVVSACGAQALDGEFNLNEWLIARGDLVLSEAPESPTRIEHCAVDWAQTRAWAGDDGAIYLNIAGREPEGCIAPADAESILAALRTDLQTLHPPVEAYRPSALYGVENGVAPELIAVCTQPGWRPSPLVGRNHIWTSTADASLAAGWEAPRGFFVLHDPHDPTERELDEATIFDVLPTLLALLGEQAGPRLRGRTLLEPVE